MLNEGHCLYFIVDKPESLPSDIQKQAAGIRYFRYKLTWWRRWYYRRLVGKYLDYIDVIHCHNEPNRHTLDAVRASEGRAPVIYDIHDFTSLRKGKPDSTEEKCFDQVDGIVHSADSFRNIAKRKYPEAKQQNIVLYSTPSRTQLRGSEVLPKIASAREEIHLVYQGGLIDENSTNADLFSYRDYLDIFRSILNEGFHLHLYCAYDKIPTGYQQLASGFPEKLHLNARVPYPELLTTMSRFHWGLTGFNFSNLRSETTREFLHSVVPNKMFDYLHAGIPTLVFNANAASRIAREYGFGLEKAEEESWADVLDRGASMLKKDLTPAAESLTMESQIPRLVSLYRSWTGIRKS